MTELNLSGIDLSSEFRDGCANFGITDESLSFALTRSDLHPRELLSIDTTTSSRNFRVAYTNKAGEKKWAHLFLVPKTPAA
ncbi:MAG: hypothetical protein ACE5FN_11280 [Leptospirillia bacterium]